MSIYGDNQAKDYKAAQRRYRQRRSAAAGENVFEPGETKASFLKKLENVPTPQEYLRDLSED